MFTENINLPTGYTSLNSSIVVSTQYSHSRTQSQSKIPISPGQPQTHRRTPSQKKLTLTCQNRPYGIPKQIKDSESCLKKKGADYLSNKTHFTSLQNSGVTEQQNVNPSHELGNSQLTNIKRYFEQKIKFLASTYSSSLSEYSQQIRQLQIKLLSNSRSLQVKDKKIAQLQTICEEYNEKMKRIPTSGTVDILSKKINDIQSKIRVIVTHYEGMTEQNNQKIDNLTQGILSSFSNKLKILKLKSTQYAKTSLTKIAQLELQLDHLRLKGQKHSQETRGSIESVGSIPQPNPLENGNVSFWDDCFFYPTQHSQDYQLIIEMTKRRLSPLSCWIDQQKYLHYTDTNSYLYNRKGDRIKLTQDELQELINQSLMIIV